MAANPKDHFCVIHLCQCHPYKDQQWPIWTHPSVFIGIYVTWSDWDRGCSSVRLDHIAHAMQHLKVVDKIKEFSAQSNLQQLIIKRVWSRLLNKRV